MGIGIMYLVKSDQITNPLSIDTLLASPCWTNPHVNGVVIRSPWNRIQPAKHDHYWDFLDAGINKALEVGKKVSISVVAGAFTPAWFATEYPDDCFLVTTERGPQVLMALPWRPNFQSIWGLMLKKLAKRYDHKIVHIDMGGFGRRAESYFATVGDDFARLTTLVRAQGYPDAPTAWLIGAKWVTDAYAQTFVNAGFICDLGAPFVGDIGVTSLQYLIDYGATTYPGRFGGASHGLEATQPSNNSIGMNLPPTIRRGFQFGSPEFGDTVSMQAALNRGIGAGAQWIEVYDNDCDDPAQAANLDAANAAMLS